MAFVQNVNPPIDGMTRILNVSHKVGASPDCLNDHNDVEAVQRLIAIAASQFAGSHGFGLPQPTGRFDPITGFYIFRLQWYSHSFNPGAIVDGCVSPQGASPMVAGPLPLSISTTSATIKIGLPGRRS